MTTETTTEETEARIRAEAEEKITKLRREAEHLAAVAHLQPGYTHFAAHDFTRSGTGDIWIVARHSRYDSIREGKNPDAALFTGMLDALPPVPAVLLHGSGTMSVEREDRPRRYQGTRDPIAPVWCEADPNDFARDFDVTWYAGDNLRVKVEFPLWDLAAARHHGTMRFNQRGEVTEKIDQWETHNGATARRWSSGSEKAYGRAVVYWPRTDEAIDWPETILTHAARHPEEREGEK